MSFYAIVAVRKEAVTGHVAYVRWGLAERGVPGWVSEPVTAAASEVIEAIKGGADVETVVSVDGLSVASRPVRVVTDQNGREHLASVPAPSSTLHTVFDLPEF
ncbi:carbohydrate isomerase [Achromobacter xylosoxidans]|uniref:carbohydrate isomerase n=1 Tax=Alcaligenes xylosoxydans xylosoxydans TaxID=85698 RepID=UPI001F12A0AF|nr:carbohydrate isomerase [Achromobacter xylosoxidans]